MLSVRHMLRRSLRRWSFGRFSGAYMGKPSTLHFCFIHFTFSIFNFTFSLCESVVMYLLPEV